MPCGKDATTGRGMHKITMPEGVFEPVKGLYSQVITTTSPIRHEIAGSLAYDAEGGLPETLPDQCRAVMRNIDLSLKSVGMTPANVIRMRIYTLDMDVFLKEGLSIVFGYFGDVRPTSTLVQIIRLANPKMLVEIDATAAPFD
jgi:enamine deaminase RidA (YjgF/YER057c/UK114 family)